MPEGVTILSKKIYSLHMLILWICVAIAVVVFGAMIYSIVKFRKSQGAEADKTLVHSTKVEIIWTVIPIVILVGMAVPIARTLIEIEDMGKRADLNIKVTGYQWKWEYEYLGQNVSFFSTLKRDSDAARQLGSGIDPETRFLTTCSTWTTRWSSRRARRSASCSPRRTSSTPGGCRTSA